MPGKTQDPNLSITNTTTSPSLSTKLEWNEMNRDTKEVNILYNYEIYIICGMSYIKLCFKC